LITGDLAGRLTAAFDSSAALLLSPVSGPVAPFLAAVMIGAGSICLIALANTMTQFLSPPDIRGGITASGQWRYRK